MANKCVCIMYNGYFIVPAPMVSISRSFQEDGSGRVIGSTLNIKLEGKIINASDVNKTRQQIYTDLANNYDCPINSTNGVGISRNGINNMMEEERALRKVFTNTKLIAGEKDKFGNSINNSPDANRLYITAGGNIIVDGYAKVVNYNSNPTNNNWVNTIDYNVEFIIEEPAEQFINDSNRYLLSSVTDEISIEPLDEVYTFNQADPVFNAYFGASLSNLYAGDYTQYSTRYRITRNISAVGKHSYNVVGGSTTESSPGEIAGGSAWNDVLGDTNRVPRTLVSLGQKSAFTNARLYVQERLKRYPTQYYLDSWTIVNRVRTLTHNELAGNFGVNETCIVVDPTYHPAWADDWTAEVSTDSSFMQTVRINGTIKGYETYGTNIQNDSSGVYGVQNSAGTTDSHQKSLQPALKSPSTATSTDSLIGKYQNAVKGIKYLKEGTNNVYNSPIANRAALFFRAGNSSTATNNPYKWLNNATVLNERVSPALSSLSQANPIPVSMTESHRPHAGEIDYSFEFNNRPLNLVPGSISETLNINDTFPVQQIAEIFVLGRKLGPVLQDLNTVSAASRELTFEVVIPKPRSLAARTIFPTDIYKSVVSIVEQFNPKYMFGTTDTTIKSFVKTDNQTWNPIEGRLSVTKGWIWQRGK